MEKNHQLTPVEETIIALTSKWSDEEFTRIYKSGRYHFYSAEMKEAFLKEYEFRTKFVKQPDVTE